MPRLSGLAHNTEEQKVGNIKPHMLCNIPCAHGIAGVLYVGALGWIDVIVCRIHGENLILLLLITLTMDKC